jgi:polyisoprenoid-binding protein YceI
MKVLSNLLIALLTMSLVVACTPTPEGEAAKTGEAQQEAATPTTAKTFNITGGTLYWVGTKVGGQHNGTIAVSDGNLNVAGDNIASGEFTIDMASIQNMDLPEDKKGKLVGHLQSADFFNVAEFPTSTFTIVSVTPATGEDVTHNITGNLTIKGITKSITIPANVVIMNDKLTAVTPKFTINRTNWDVKYGSGIIGTAQDKIIHDDISLNLELNAEATTEG